MPNPTLDRQIHHDQEPQYQKPHAPHRPRIPHLLHQPHKEHRKHHSPNPRPRRRNPKRRSPIGQKPRRYTSRRSIIYRAGPKRRTHALGQENLIVSIDETGRHPAINLQGGANEQQPSGTVVFEEFADDEAGGVDDEELDGGDEGEGGRGGGVEEGGLVVGVEEREAEEGTPGCEEDAPGSEDDEPGVETTIWEAVRGGSGSRLWGMGGWF